MNNIEQKNAIMRLTENIGLPYLYPGHIAYETATNISQTNLNNTFIQLVDNDLYIENKLVNDYEYSIGPKPFNLDSIDAAENGYKTWGNFNSYELSILQKKEQSQQDSLTEVFPTRSYFAFKYEDQYYVGTDDGLLFSDEYEGTWRVLQPGKCRNYWYNEGNNVVLFACFDGIYQLKLNAENKKRILKITKGIYDCRAVFFRPEDSLMLVCAEDGIYYATYSKYFATFDDFDKNYETVELLQCDVYTKDMKEVIEDAGLANVFTDVKTGLFPYKNSVFAGLETGLAQLAVVNDFIQYKYLPDGHSYKSVKTFKDKTFIGTADGLYAYGIYDNSLSATALAEEDITCIEIHADEMYVCADGKLYKSITGILEDFVEVELNAEDGSKIENISKIAFIGTDAVYAFAVAVKDGDVVKQLHYGFKDSNDVVQIPLECDAIFDICTYPSKMTLDIAYSNNNQRLIKQIAFPSIKRDEDKSLEKAQLVKIGIDPAIVDEENPVVVKHVHTPERSFVVTEHAIYDEDDFSISCSFNKSVDEFAKIYDVKYLPEYSTLVVMFEDAQLSAVKTSLDIEQDTGMFYISQLVKAMEAYGLEGVYDYQEFQPYVAIVTKQVNDLDPSKCDQAGNADDTYKGSNKYFVSYIDTTAVGMQCDQFFHSPVTLDAVALQIGTFSTPPKLFVKDGKLAVFDVEQRKFCGYIGTQQQQVTMRSFPRNLMNIQNQQPTIFIKQLDSYENNVFACGYTKSADGTTQVEGLFLAKITDFNRSGVGTYSAIYEDYNGSNYKLLLNGIVNKIKVVDDNAYLCTEAGLYVVSIDELLSLETTIEVSELVNNSSFRKLVSGTINDIAFGDQNSVIAATTTGLKIQVERYKYVNIDGTCEISGLDQTNTAGYSSCVLKKNESEYCQLIYNTKIDCPAKAAKIIKNNSGSISYSTYDVGLALSVDDIIYCKKYTEDDEMQSEFQDNFLAVLNKSTGISALYFNDVDQTTSITSKSVYSGDDIACIGTAVFQDTLENSDIIDGRFIIASKSNGELSTYYIKNRGTPAISIGGHSPISDIGNNTIIAVGSRLGTFIDETGSEPKFSYMHQICQISKNKAYFNQREIAENEITGGYSYKSAFSSSTLDLPASIQNTSWTSFKIINNILYVQQNDKLYIVVLDSAFDELTVNYSTSNVQQVYFNYDSAIIRKANKYYAIEYGKNSESGEYIFNEHEIDFKSYPFQRPAQSFQKIGNIVFCNLYNELTQKYETAIAQYMMTLFEKTFDNHAFQSVIFKTNYQIQNAYNVYAKTTTSDASNPNCLLVCNIDENTLDASTTSIVDGSTQTQQLIYKSSEILLYRKPSNGSNIQEGIYRLTYTDNFNVQLVQSFEDSLITSQYGKIEVSHLLDAFTNKVEIKSEEFKLLNLIFQIKQEYNGQYIIPSNDYINKICVFIPSGTYTVFNSLDSTDNNNLQLVINDNVITDSRTIALKLEDGSLKWYELLDNMTLYQLQNNNLTQIEKLADKLINAVPFVAVEKIASNDKNSCFVYGTIEDNGNIIHSWYYTHYQIANEKLELTYEASSIPQWIVDNINSISINDIYKYKDNIRYCTTLGLWKNVYKQQFEFVSDYDEYELDDDSKNFINNGNSSILKIYLLKSNHYRQYSSIAKIAVLDNGSIMYNAIGLTYKTTDTSKNLALYSNSIVGTEKAEKFKQLLMSEDSSTNDVFYIRTTGSKDELIRRTGIKSQAIDDTRDTLNKILYANCINMSNNLIFVLNDDQDEDNRLSFRFKQYNKNKICFKLLTQQNAEMNITMFMQYGKNVCAVGYNDGNAAYIQKLDFNQVAEDEPIVTEPLYSVDDTIAEVHGAYKYIPESEILLPTYFFTVGNKVVNVQILDNTSSWKELLSTDSSINGLHVDNLKKTIIATDGGLFYTYSKYELINNIKKLTPNDVLDLFYDNINIIDETYAATISSHINSRHAPGSVVTRINNEIMDTKFSNIAEDWVKYDLDAGAYGETITYNDLLNEIKFGDINGEAGSEDETVYADVWNTVYSKNNIPLNYIMKRWMSGYTELYINLPTTGTYYLNHVLGVPNCTTNPNQLIERKNLSQLSTLKIDERAIDSQVSSNYTHISVYLQKSEYSVDELLEVSIHGNSLPLKIYRDNIERHYDEQSSRLYQSVILPSVVEDAEATFADGYYCFKFACFGTDAQAIKIAFIDNIRRYGSKYYTIEFNNNNGAGKLQSQKVRMDETVELNRNKSIYKTNAAFLGWSLKSTVDGMAMPMLLDGAEVNKEILESLVDNLKIKPGSKITLFAVWENYELPETAEYTVFTVKVENANDKLIAVYSNQFDENIQPKNTLVVDYGD